LQTRRNIVTPKIIPISIVNEAEERERKGKESDTVSEGESTSGRERERRIANPK
jgi:hypothetical protein